MVSLAANKLLLGHPPGTGSYNEDTMFGVASMLCRLGVLPYSTSVLASQAVADFMVILSYVNYEKEGFLSSYAIDPVLTLGAMKGWYGLDEALANYILPQLKTLMLDEALDTGGIGELVARIVLLLAIDKCVMGTKSNLKCKITGQFVSVLAFLEVLGFRKMSVVTPGLRAARSDQRVAFYDWPSQWND